MTDMEKVLNGLAHCLPVSEADGDTSCDTCPYYRCYDSVSLSTELVEDIRSLLKELDNCENCAIAIEERQLIVSCKDCIWYWKETNQTTGYCKLHDGTNCGPDFFCADGKLK